MLIVLPLLCCRNHYYAPDVLMGVYDILGLCGYYHVSFDRESLHVGVQEFGMNLPWNAKRSFVCGNADWNLKLFIVGELPFRFEATEYRGPWVTAVRKRVVRRLEFTENA